MKQVIASWKMYLALVIATLGQLALFGQDQPSGNGGSSTTITTETTETTTWYTQPWVWIVGGIILLILIVALVRGNSGPTHTSRTTVVKD
ncbi:MAG TPA: hypothetical protein VEB63_04085 [Chitinophagaceae bacterium]|nr:hypothetical protein [Chitinophagaceae bacterium]